MSDKVKKAHVADSVFIPTVVRVCTNGGSHQDVADELGMAVGSVATRLSNIRKRFKEDGVDCPLPGFQRGNGGNRRKAAADYAVLINAAITEAANATE